MANASWPLEELTLTRNDLSAAAAGPALAALSRLVGLRRLDVGSCMLSAAGFKALVEAAWPALTSLCAVGAEVALDGPLMLGAAAFAGLPALEELNLQWVKLGEAGARLLSSRRWPHLRKLNLCHTLLEGTGLAALARGAWPALEELDLWGVALGEAGARLLASRRWPRLRVLCVFGCGVGDTGLAALAGGEWPALERLNLRRNQLTARLALDDARRWAPALVELRQ